MQTVRNTTNTVKISPILIWASSIFLGALSSLPHFAQAHFNAAEAIVNAALTATFALMIWYFNIAILTTKTVKSKRRISYNRLFGSLLFGIVIMFLLAWIQQLILSNINFGPVMLMVEVRGILINLLFFMFLHLLQQNFENQQVRMELERTKNDNLGAQYELLKQQVNPHFLFNSLTTLKSMVEIGDQQSADFIMELSNFYRFTLESRKHDLINVSEEIKIMQAYLFLQKARFEEGFTFTNNIDDKLLTTLIPPFTLQLLIENCIKHNVVSLSKPLHIRLYSDKDHIIIENQIQPKLGDSTSTGVGLININLRYKHLLEKEIEVSSNENIFKIKLPLIYEYHPY